PPTLSIETETTVSACSKGASGLSILRRVGGIFTAITTSLSSSSRQRSTRYTIRAGRNLPDKEFRYLRTVIVTADIHGGLISELRLAPDPKISPFRIGHVSHPIRRLHDFAECCVFVKQSVDPFHCDPSCDGHPFFRSYGARLPSSLTRFHSRALVYSTHPPVSVYVTGTLVCAGVFLG